MQIGQFCEQGRRQRRFELDLQKERSVELSAYTARGAALYRFRAGLCAWPSGMGAPPPDNSPQYQHDFSLSACAARGHLPRLRKSVDGACAGR